MELKVPKEEPESAEARWLWVQIAVTSTQDQDKRLKVLEAWRMKLVGLTAGAALLGSLLGDALKLFAAAVHH